jgi:hypothetical protein
MILRLTKSFRKSIKSQVPDSAVHGYQRFRERKSPPCSGWKVKGTFSEDEGQHEVPSERQYSSTREHGVIAQKPVI